MLKPNNTIIFARNPRSTLTDKAYIKSCDSFVQLKHEINKYMTYYNHSCYQWNLKKMTSVEYRNHLLQVFKMSFTKGTVYITPCFLYVTHYLVVMNNIC